MATGDPCATIIREIPPNWLFVAYTSGSTEPSPGDVIWGDTSDANAFLELVVQVTGTWGGGDSAGWMFFSNWEGTPWTSGENFTANTSTPGNHGTLTLTPVACFATTDTINDVLVADFDDTANEAVLYLCKLLPNYAGGGITVKFEQSTAAATGDLSYGGMFRSFTDDVDNLLHTSFNAWGNSGVPIYNAAIDAPSVIGEITYDSIAFTDGTQIDSVAVDELFQFLLFRDAQDSTNDDHVGDGSVIDVSFTLT